MGTDITTQVLLLGTVALLIGVVVLALLWRGERGKTRAPGVTRRDLVHVLIENRFDGHQSIVNVYGDMETAEGAQKVLKQMEKNKRSVFLIRKFQVTRRVDA